MNETTAVEADNRVSTPFLSDLKTIRERAQRHMEQGAVTPGYDADLDTVLRLLNEALATELVCVLRYKRHYFIAEGILAEAIKQEFLVHAQEEQGHADLIAERIVQLGGDPNFDPTGLATRAHSEYASSDKLDQMLKEDLLAERVAIESYREMIHYLQRSDSTTRRMLEGILAKEEEHAEELSSMLRGLKEVQGTSGRQQGIKDR
jgi:bacterioferritin